MSLPGSRVKTVLPIRVVADNASTIQLHLNRANITHEGAKLTFADVFKACHVLARELAVPNRVMEGVVYDFDPGVRDPVGETSTHCQITFSRNCWKLAGVAVGPTRPKGQSYVCLTMPPALEEYILGKLKVIA